MKTELQKRLATVAPLVCIETLWEEDDDQTWDDPANADWTQGENPEDWRCWHATVRVTVIHNGEKLTGCDYLGETWLRAEELPAIANPTISGYEQQLTRDALQDCLDFNFAAGDNSIVAQHLRNALAAL